MVVFFSLVGVWIVVNLLIAVVTSIWHWRWCRSVSWTAAGTLPSAVPIERGVGETAALFVHGFNDVPYVWTRIIDELVQKGVHCRALCLPGAGTSSCHPTLVSLRGAVDCELAELRKRYARVVLVGHSMGGALAIDAVLRKTERSAFPDKLVLLAPLVEISRARSPIFAPAVYYRLLRLLFPLLRWVPSVFREYLSAEDDDTFVYRRDRFNEIGWYAALFDLIASLRRANRRHLAVPTVVYVAGQDRVVDSEATRRWFGDLPCVQIVERPASSHVVPLNVGWRDIVSEIARV